MYNFTTDHLQISFGGYLWIKTDQQKTGTETNIRLLDTAKHIIKKYSGIAEGNKLLPVPCYANCRDGIKAVARLCGIKKNICWHQSRRSYATTLCLSNVVPIETLSKLMGHTSIHITQIYAKSIAEKVSNDIENLSKQIESMESVICNAIWMSTNELIDLFVIIYPTLRANIKAIYKSGILDECEVQRCINLSNGISIKVYALPMIVALSFRLNTLGAYKVRECVMNKLTTKSRYGILFLNVHTHKCMNESKFGLN